ncbi:unnamed protein product [Rodentolepis nana]|uniref:Trafficking protein particle complex subunit 13 n=1 Tax=Rodentolepis nana TaxID=102285 RepID=A0A0R3T0E9_RODNA|nr:unnamed protein product [Rodentolepis nana]
METNNIRDLVRTAPFGNCIEEWHIFFLQLDRLLKPNGPALGITLVLGDDYVLRCGSLKNFSLENEGSSTIDQLKLPFYSSAEKHQLRVMQDLRLSLAIPVSGYVEDNLNQNPTIRVFKPLKFSLEGSLACVAFSTPQDSDFAPPGDSLILRYTQMGLLIVHFDSDVPLPAAVCAVEQLNVPV